jgi:hypothetical protein
MLSFAVVNCKTKSLGDSTFHYPSDKNMNIDHTPAQSHPIPSPIIDDQKLPKFFPSHRLACFLKIP